MAELPIQFGGADLDGKEGKLKNRTNKSFKTRLNYKGGIESAKGIGYIRDYSTAIATNDANVYGVYPYYYPTMTAGILGNIQSITFAGNGLGGIPIAQDSNYIYIICGAISPAVPVLYRVSTDDFTIVSSLTLPSSVGNWGGINGMTVQGNYLYVGLYLSALQVCRINLLDFTTCTFLTLSPALKVLALTSDSTYLYCGVDGGGTNPSQIIRVTLSDFSTMSAKAFAAGQTAINSMAVDQNYVYAGLNCSPTQLVRLNLSDFTTLTTKTLAAGIDNLTRICIDSTYLYGTINNTPYQVFKLALSDFSTYTAKLLAFGTDVAVVDSTYFYYAGNSIVNRLLLSDFTTVSTVPGTSVGAFLINGRNLYQYNGTTPITLTKKEINVAYKTLASVKKLSTGAYSIYDVTTPGSETLLLATVNYYDDPVTSTTSGVIFLTGGTNELQLFRYDGTNTPTLVGPSCSYQAYHLGRVFVITKGGVLYWSNVNDGQTYQTLNTDNVFPNENDIVTGIWAYGGALYVFKQHNVYSITGNDFDNVNSTSNYVISQVNIPGLSKRSAFTIYNGNMYYKSKDKGLVVSNGSSFQVIQEGINSDTFTFFTDFANFLKNNKEIITNQGRYDPQLNEYFPYSIPATFGFSSPPLTSGRLLNYYILNNRYLYQLDYSYTANGETAVDEYSTDWLTFDDERSTKKFNRLYLNLEKTGSWNLKVDVFIDFNTTAVKTLTYSLAPSAVDKYIRLDLGLTGVAIRFRFYMSAINNYFVINSAVIDVDIADDGRKPVK